MKAWQRLPLGFLSIFFTAFAAWQAAVYVTYRADFKADIESTAVGLKPREMATIRIRGAAKVCFQAPFTLHDQFMKATREQVTAYETILSEDRFAIHTFDHDHLHRAAILGDHRIRMSLDMARRTCDLNGEVVLRREGEFVLVGFPEP